MAASSMRGVRDLVARLRHGLVADADADEFLELARVAFNADAAALVQDGSFANWNRHAGIPDAWFAQYERYRHQDFMVHAAQTAPVGTWHLARRDNPRNAWDLDLTGHFLGLGFDDCALVQLKSPVSGDLHFVLYRARGRRRFSEENRALLELMSPHLSAALGARSALAAIDPSRAGRRTPHVWLSYPSHRVIWTEAARELWRRCLGTIGSQGWQRIEHALWRAADLFASAPSTGRFFLLRADLRVEMAFVPPRRDEQRRVLALMIPQPTSAPVDDTPQTPAEELLSPTQLAIARAAAGGLSARQIARARHISEETVRSHLKAVYDRLGASRTLLASLVLPISRQAAPPRQSVPRSRR